MIPPATGKTIPFAETPGRLIGAVFVFLKGFLRIRCASALTRTEDSQRRRTAKRVRLLEWLLDCLAFSSRLNIARICKGSSRTERLCSASSV